MLSRERRRASLARVGRPLRGTRRRALRRGANGHACCDVDRPRAAASLGAGTAGHGRVSVVGGRRGGDQFVGRPRAARDRGARLCGRSRRIEGRRGVLPLDLRAEHAARQNHRCTDYYADADEASRRIVAVTDIAATAARALPSGRGHTVILAGMTAYYATSGWTANAQLHRRVASTVGLMSAPLLWTLRIRALLGRLRAQPSSSIS